MLDMLIRNGHVHDGSGLAAYRADVGIAAGRVVAIGPQPGPAQRVIDARGLAVAPGFIDIHTHFDAQLGWDGYAVPMLEHGVTTVVTGNCSLSLAPLRPEQRIRMARMFGQIEQIPYAAFEAGIDWRWETFPEWIARHEPSLGINVAPLVGHSALRMWVMGEDAHRRAATAKEAAELCEVLGAALAAGASGLSISHIDTDERGQPVPSRLADRAELRALCETLGAAPGSMLQIVPEYWSTEKMLERVDELAQLSLETGVVTTFAPLLDQTPGLALSVLERLEQVWQRGARVFAQLQPRGIEVNFRLSEWSFVLSPRAGWLEVVKLKDRAEQRRRYSDPELRRQLVASAYPSDDARRRELLDATWISAVGDSAQERLVGRTLRQVADERGVGPAEAMLEVALADNLETRFTQPATSNVDAELIARLLEHPAVLIGASDAGAHVRSFSTYGDTGYVFERYVRGGTLRTEEAVKRLTSDPAHAFGLHDRGLLAAGRAADVVVFDPVAIGRGPDVDVADLPGGHRRYLRRSLGVCHTVVNGQLAWSADAGYSEARAGRCVSRGR